MKDETPKRKMQAVKFRDMEEFLAYLPDDELAIVESLRALVLEMMPESEERLSYNVPYYRLRTMVCFIWPASVTWGKKKTFDGVLFGFPKGYLMEDSENILLKGNRKQVFWVKITALSQIDKKILRAYLNEAILLDALAGKKS